MHTKREVLKTMHLAGKLQIAGHSVLPEAVPQDVLENAPRPPKLGKMVVTGKGGDQHSQRSGTTTRCLVPSTVPSSTGSTWSPLRASLSGLSGVIGIVMCSPGYVVIVFVT